MSLNSSFTKNFTALIPGTTVEILDQDSKNVIQLIITAYNVSICAGMTVSVCGFLFVCVLSSNDTEGFDKKDKKRGRKTEANSLKSSH